MKNCTKNKTAAVPVGRRVWLSRQTRHADPAGFLAVVPLKQFAFNKQTALHAHSKFKHTDERMDGGRKR